MSNSKCRSSADRRDSETCHLSGSPFAGFSPRPGACQPGRRLLLTCGCLSAPSSSAESLIFRSFSLADVKTFSADMRNYRKHPGKVSVWAQLLINKISWENFRWAGPRAQVSAAWAAASERRERRETALTCNHTRFNDVFGRLIKFQTFSQIHFGHLCRKQSLDCLCVWACVCVCGGVVRARASILKSRYYNLAFVSLYWTCVVKAP